MSKKKHTEEDDERAPAPAPKVGTSMKGLLAGVKLGGKPERAKPAAPPAKAGPPKPRPKAAAIASAPGRPRPPAPPPPPPETSAPVPLDGAHARPSESLRGHDRTAFFDAMAGVRGIGARPGAPPPRATSLKLPAALPAPEVREGDLAARARLAALVTGGLRFELRHEQDWHAGMRHDAPRGTLEALASAMPSKDASLDLHGVREADVEARVAKFVRHAHQHGLRRVRVVHGKGLHSDAAGPVLGDAVIRALTQGSAAAWVLAFVTAPEAQGGAGAMLVELTK